MPLLQDPPLWHTLRGRLTLILMLALLPVVFLSIAEAGRAVMTTREQNRMDFEQLSRLLTDEYKLVFNGAFQALAVLQHQPEIEDPYSKDCPVTLERALAGSFDMLDISVVESTGAIACSSVPIATNGVVGPPEWLMRIQAEKRPIIGGPIISPITHQSVLVAAVPLDIKDSPGTGAIVVSVYRGMLDRIRRLAEVPPDLAFYLVTPDAKLLLASTGDEKNASELPLPPAEFAKALHSPGHVMKLTDVGGHARTVVLVPIVEDELYGLVTRPQLSLSAGQVVVIISQIVLPTGLTALALFIVWLATERNVVRWVRHLRAVATAYRRGNMRVRTRNMDAAPHELAQLGTTMEQMADAITDRELKLVENIAQRELLLRELNHRVKNNLQIITSLLNMQARTVETPQEEAIIREVQARVEAIALVHRGVTGANQNELIDMREFLPQLGEQLMRYYSRPDAPIEITTTSDEVLLSIDDTIPFAQLVTEVVTESYKHASSHGIAGHIGISVAIDGESARLEIGDDSIRGEGAGPKDRMGAALIRALAHQIGGKAEFTTNGTSRVMVRFPYRSINANDNALHAS